jgi:serine/threonine protein kinase
MSQQDPVGPGIGERNLLFSMLALQMDFVRQEALVAAMQAWVFDKRQPLGEILTRQGHLSAERLHLLNALVEEHLKAHQNDPEQSLAALRVDPALRRSLDQWPGEGEGTLPFLAPAAAPAAGSRYRVLRPHAKGGLGEVFVAEDLELHREIALKVIQGPQADDTLSRDRFRLEAEITGRLDHPGIAPVHGLGTDAEGRPFYAMRLVQGETLKESVARFHAAEAPGRDPGERSLALRRLLTRFVAVCNTVAYAHSRGVIHRDLKPSNILLGSFGETIVLDWGLAKVVGRADRAEGDVEVTLRPQSGDYQMTQAGTTLGTAAFMSPEQAAGRIDQQGPPADIYSLGATLYALLTGRPPFTDADHFEILQKVQTGTFPPPRQVNKAVARPLDAVCCKAMALRPADRYATALELGAEVEQWLADEPVRAWPEPWRVRWLRWAKRRPLLSLWIATSTLVYASILVSALTMLLFAAGIGEVFLVLPPILFALLAFGMSMGAQLAAVVGAGVGHALQRVTRGSRGRAPGRESGAARGARIGIVVGAMLGYLGVWTFFFRNWLGSPPADIVAFVSVVLLCPLLGAGLGAWLVARNSGKLRGAVLGGLAAVPVAAMLMVALMLVTLQSQFHDPDLYRLTEHSRLVDALLHLEKHADTIRVVQEYAAAFPDDMRVAYFAAHSIARAVPIAEKDAKLAPDERRALVDEYGRLAVQQLRQAVRLGYCDVSRIKSHPDLDPLRDRQDFRDLLAELGIRS